MLRNQKHFLIYWVDDDMTESPLNIALRHFEATESNLQKLENVWKEMESLIPDGIAFGDSPEYEKLCRNFDVLLSELPKIDRWKPEIRLMDLNEIGQSRFDAEEIGEIECRISVESAISKPGRLLREYRYKFDTKRRDLIRETINELTDTCDQHLKVLGKYIKDGYERNQKVIDPLFEDLREKVNQIDTLIGSSISRPSKWGDLRRHLSFGFLCDLSDIIQSDWPIVTAELSKSLYDEREPIPVEIDDLSTLVSQRPRGVVATRLNWDRLTPDEFERLIFVLISSEKGYENPQWLTRTNAADRGRDLSVYRVHIDGLGGTIRDRVIIQCKHWLSKSISVSDVATLREQMKLWEPPRVNVHIIVTSGRFTSDAVDVIEKQNQADSALRIEMWPESHLEHLLASRPAYIAEFKLR